MPCYHPLNAMRSSSGIQFTGDTIGNIKIPCGRCVGCRLERSRQWSVRIMHESQLHAENSFITLTYDDAHVPSDYSLRYPDFQKFMKRLRKHTGLPIRYYMCGEYGETFSRPHFHSCIFGFRPEDGVEFSKSGGNPIYTSEVLSKLWPFGFSSFGELTFESAAYVARYVMKKITGDAAKSHYEVIDDATGEVIQRVPEFAHMSLKPGIGSGWYDKFHSDVFPHDEVIARGFPCKPPRYYDKLLKRTNSVMHDEIKLQRVLDNYSKWRDNTPERLKIKETVKNAQISNLKRKIL